MQGPRGGEGRGGEGRGDWTILEVTMTASGVTGLGLG